MIASMIGYALTIPALILAGLFTIGAFRKRSVTRGLLALNCAVFALLSAAIAGI